MSKRSRWISRALKQKVLWPTKDRVRPSHVPYVFIWWGQTVRLWVSHCAIQKKTACTFLQILEPSVSTDPNGKRKPEYRIHFLGWKTRWGIESTWACEEIVTMMTKRNRQLHLMFSVTFCSWDRIVPETFVLKWNDDTKEMQKRLSDIARHVYVFQFKRFVCAPCLCCVWTVSFKLTTCFSSLKNGWHFLLKQEKQQKTKEKDWRDIEELFWRENPSGWQWRRNSTGGRRHVRIGRQRFWWDSVLSQSSGFLFKFLMLQWQIRLMEHKI